VSKYRIKKVISKYGTETFTAQFRFLGIWFDLSYGCSSFEHANSYVEACVYRERLKGAKPVVEFIEPDLSRLIQ
jgi:hypothetical protein